MECVFEYNVPSREWTQSFECPQSAFGLAAIENELILVGGVVTVEAGGPVIEGTEEVTPTNKVQSLTLSTSSKQLQWQEKYPPMPTARVWPEVVVSGKYLIALAGRTSACDATNIVEVLDLEKKRWFSNDKINLPAEFNTAKWQSACICGQHIFIAVKYDDPKFEEKMEPLNDKYDDYDDPIDPGDPYPCFSLYRCSVDTLLQLAQEEATEDATSLMKREIWQQLKHPHHSVYRWLKDDDVKDNVLPTCNDENPDPYLNNITEYFHYGLCSFTLSCMNNDTLVAVGCKHIKSTTTAEVDTLLDSAYFYYRVVKKLICNDGAEVVDHYTEPDKKCYIYLYNMENDSWEMTKSIDLMAEKNFARPSVAVVKQNIVFLKGSTTTHIVTLPTP